MMHRALSKQNNEGRKKPGGGEKRRMKVEGSVKNQRATIAKRLAQSWGKKQPNQKELSVGDV